jgi:exopolyphosphatase / guanosine-5'-triphosphate,3'-diphosphate pyrophosphatase
MKGVRCAVISIGTNSTRLLIARVEDGALFPEYHESRGTRLGEGLTPSAALAPAAVERTLAAVADYARLSQGIERTYLIGTCALREASDADRFALRARELVGVSLAVLTGDEEARASFEGALYGIVSSGVPIGDAMTVVDVGGGSVEFARRDTPASTPETSSLALGAVALTERFLSGDPPTAEEVLRCRGAIRLGLKSLMDNCRPRGTIVAVGGTATTVAEMLQVEWFGDVAKIPRGDLLDVTRLVANATVAQRRRMHGIPEQRADIVCAGLLVLDEVSDSTGTREMYVARTDLLAGYMLMQTGRVA